MNNMRLVALIIFPLMTLMGCAGPKSQVLPEDAVNFNQYRCIGVMPFRDPRGQGQAVSDAIENGLQKLMYEPVDEKILLQVLKTNAPDRDAGFGVEALEIIRKQTSVDAIIFGRMIPDWSAASITMVETKVGLPVLHAVLRPNGKKKFFTGPDDVAQEMLHVLTNLR